ncbi:MAG: sensor histidine kinase [Ferruginibacter sp.]
MKQPIVIFLFILAGIACASAQNPVFRKINNLNGLPSNTIYDMLQDANGFIWLAHDKGLSKYDGKTFVNFQANSQQGKAISNLIEYKSTVWCQDFTGVFYHTKNDSLTEETAFTQNGLFSPAQLLNNNLLFSCSDDSIRIKNLETNQKFGIKLPLIFPCPVTSNPYKLFILSNLNLYETNGYTVHMKTLPKLTNTALLLSVKNNLYGVAKNTYPYFFDLKDSCKPIYILKPGLFIQSVNNINDEIWVSTTTGAYCFDLQFRPKYDGFCFFKGNSINKIIKDREGNYWFSTINRGVFLVTSLHFRLYAFNETAITTLAGNLQTKTFYAGTEKSELLEFKEDYIFNKKFEGKTNHEVLGLQLDNNNNFYLFSNAFISLDKNYGYRWEIPMAVKSCASINDEIFAVAYTGGVGLISKTGNPIKIPIWLQRKGADWNTSKCYPLLEQTGRARWVCFDTKDSVLYAATSAGLFYFSPKENGEIKFNGAHIFAAQIQINNNEVYVATFNNGLLRVINHEAHPFLSTRQGLNSNTIFNFKISGNKFWMIQENALMAYDTSTREIVHYDNTDGMPKAEIKDVFVFENNVFVATTDGLVVFNKNLITKNVVAPLFSLNEFWINGKKVDYENDIHFNASQNNIELLFSVLSYRGEGALTIKYKINESNWLTIQNDARVLPLPALSPGYYKIQFQAFNEDGVADETPLVINFTIDAPWYKQMAVWITGLIFFSFILFVYFKQRIRNINKNNLLEQEKLTLAKEVQKSQLSSIKSQMNPHFLFNALNTIQAYIYTNDKENASTYLGKFSDLTRMILDMSNKETIPLSEEIKALKLYLDLEKLRFEDSFNCIIEIDDNIDPESIQVPSMLIQPYVENAIKHGLLHKKSNRQLSLTFTNVTDGIEVKVEDNGIGRKRAAALKKIKADMHESFAMSANQKRLNILNQSKVRNIEIVITDKYSDAGEPTGTIVQLYIPFTKKKFI